MNGETNYNSKKQLMSINYFNSALNKNKELFGKDGRRREPFPVIFKEEITNKKCEEFTKLNEDPIF